MLDLLSGIWAEVTGIFEFIGLTFSGMFYTIKILYESVSIPPLLANYLPPIIGLSCTTVVFIAVIKGIFGR